ncbi:MAG TPA: DUF3566 domain-containing protein [Vicinamibacterales bacterium]|nr:DUF3566 domain-containing protein [Vicinamibacterales bacterium]
MVIRRVGPLSAAKIAATLYAVMGLIGGVVFSLIGMAGVFGPQSSETFPFGSMIGAGSIVVFPIMYAFIGFIGALIGAALYNVVAGMVGGVEVDVQ